MVVTGTGQQIAAKRPNIKPILAFYTLQKANYKNYTNRTNCINCINYVNHINYTNYINCNYINYIIIYIA